MLPTNQPPPTVIEKTAKMYKAIQAVGCALMAISIGVAVIRVFGSY